MKIRIVKNSNTSDIEDLGRALKIRRDVFSVEQGITSELLSDQNDKYAFHALAYLNDVIIGTARLLKTDTTNANIARIAVAEKYRGFGIGTKLIKSLEEKAREILIVKISIFAHQHLKEYYIKLGYNYLKKSDIVYGHQLIEMYKIFD